MRCAGYLLVLAAAALWALIGPVSRLAFAEGLTPLEVATWRAGLGWVCFAVHALATGQTRAAARDLPILGLFGLAGVSLFYGSYQLAVQSGGAALASVLLYTAPAWVAALSRLVLGEVLTPLKLAAVLATLLGAGLVSLGASPGGLAVNGPAVAWGLVSGLTYALYYIFGKLYLSRYHSQTIFLYAMPAGVLGLAPFVTFHPVTPTAGLALVALALGSTYLAYLVYYAGLKRLEATRAAVTASLEPVLAAALAFAWWDERFGLAGYVGSALILGAVLLTALDNAPASPPERG